MKTRISLKPLFLTPAILFAALSLSLTTATPLKAEWQLDRNASQIGFVASSRLKSVEGLFRTWRFDGRIDDQWRASGRVVIDTASIDTRNRRRDDHLRNEDFLDTSRFRNATFTLGETVVSGDQIELRGNLELLGVTRPLSFRFARPAADQNQVTLRSETTLSRSDFGIDYSSFLNPIDDPIKVQLRLTLRRE